MSRKKKLWIISIGVAAVIVMTVFTALLCTVWRPKSKQEWLNIFQNSLAFQENAAPQKTEKSISITENGTIVAAFYQLVEINEQDGKTVGHIVTEEKYPAQDTTEFDIYDEYYFIDSMLYMYRKNGEDEVTTSFSTKWESFWQIVKENVGGAEYDYNIDLLSDIQLSHKNGHSLSAAVTEENLSAFLGVTDYAQVSDLRLNQTVNEDFILESFTMTYIIDGTQRVVTKIEKINPEYIEIKEFAKG